MQSLELGVAGEVALLESELVDLAEPGQLELGLLKLLEHELVALVRQQVLVLAKLLALLYPAVELLETSLLPPYLCQQVGQVLLLLAVQHPLLLDKHLHLKMVLLQLLQLHIALLRIFDERLGQLAVKTMHFFLQLIALLRCAFNFPLKFYMVIRLQHGLVSFILLL